MGYDVVAEDRRRDRRTVLVVLALVVLLVGGVYVAGYMLTSERLPRGTRVGDVRVGGLSPAAARAKVARETADVAVRPIEVVVQDRSFEVRPADVGLEIDVAGSVGQVPVGRSFDPREMWEALVGSTDVPLLGVAVGEGLERRVARIGDQVDEPMVEGSITFEDGRARAVYPRVGHVLDRDAATQAVQAAYPSSGARVELALADVPPTVSTVEVSRAMREVANPAVSGPVTYRFGRGLIVELGSDEVAAALRMVAVGGHLRLRVDADRLWSSFAVVDSRFADGSAGADGRSWRVGDRVLRRSQVAAFVREEVVAGFTDVVRRPPGRRVVSVPVRPLGRG